MLVEKSAFRSILTLHKFTVKLIILCGIEENLGFLLKLERTDKHNSTLHLILSSKAKHPGRGKIKV